MKGRLVRLDPLGFEHVEALAAAAADRGAFELANVPEGVDGFRAYVETALAWQDAGTAVPYAIVRLADDAVVGSTRFFDLERWSWAEDSPRRGRSTPDACEIGYSWLAPSARRTGANTEAKLLLLSHAFEEWDVLRVSLHADARNERSRAAIERLGATSEGVLRAHRLASDRWRARDSARYTILAGEWPDVKQRLESRLASR